MKKVFWLCFVVVISGYIITKSKLDSHIKDRNQNIDIRYLPNPETAAALSLGYKTAMADFYWIEAINYFGTTLTSKIKDYKYLPAYSSLILGLDPYFTVFYDFIATAFIYNGKPITSDSVRESHRFVNSGIQNLHRIGRYDRNLIVKGAFNFALELQLPKNSIPYFEMAGRIFKDQRDLLLVGSTYASFAGEHRKNAELKLEYLGFLAFEAKEKSEIFTAISILSSQGFNTNAIGFIESLRVGMEPDENVKRLIATSLQRSPMNPKAAQKGVSLVSDLRTEKILQIDYSRNWMPPEMHVLFSI